MRIADVWVGVRADLSDFRRGMAELNRTVSVGATQIGRTLSTVGAGMSRVGSAMTTNLTLPILAVGGATAKMALDFNNALTKVVALTDITAEEIGGVREEILKLAPAIGKSPEELAEAFYFLASAGFDAREAMEVLTIAASASAAGLGETQDVARTIGAVVNAYGKENITAARATDILVAAIGEGAAEAPEFAQSIGQVVGSAAQIGAKFEDVAAAIAAMTLTGLDASEATVSLNQAFVTLFKPTTEGAKALADYGLSAAGLRQQIADEGLLPVLGLLAEKFDGNAEATAAVFGNVRALRAILALTGPAASKVAVVFQDVADSTGSLDEAVATYLASPGAKLNQSMAELKVVAIEIGEDVLPVVVDVLHEIAGVAKGVAEWWGELDDGTKKLIVQMGLFLAVAGPVLSIVGKLASAAGAMFTAIGFLTSAKGIPLLITKLAQIAKFGPGAVLAIPPEIMDEQTRHLELTDKIKDAWGATGRAVQDAEGEIDQALKDLGTYASSVNDPAILISAALEGGADSLDEALRRVKDALYASDGDVQAALTSLGASASGTLDVITDGLGRFNANLATVMGEGLDEAALIAAGIPPAIAHELAAGAPEVGAGAEEMVEEVVAVLEDGQFVIKLAADVMVDPIDVAMQQAATDAATSAQDIIDALANGLAEGPDEIADELAAINESIVNSYADTTRQLDLEGALAATVWADGLADEDSRVQADAALRLQGLLDQYELLAPGALAAGELVNPALEAGIDSNMAALVTYLQTTAVPGITDPLDLAAVLETMGFDSLAGYIRGIEQQKQNASDTAQGLRRRAKKALEFTAYMEGFNGGVTYVNGIAAGIANRMWLATQKVDDLIDYMSGTDSPPYTRFKKIAAGSAKAYMGTFGKELGRGLPSIGSMMAGMLSPSFGAGLSAASYRPVGYEPRSGSEQGSGSNTYNVNLLDRFPARSVGDIGRGLRELGETGMLPGSDR